jgi:hypothetical protein
VAREKTAAVDLFHPVYLDVSMLISFLATLDDGVSFSSEVAQKRMQAVKSGVQAEAGAKLPSIATLLGLDLNASGKYSRDKTADDSTESKFVKQHTAASLFNRLRALLVKDNIVSQIGVDADLSTVTCGTVVEITGSLEETPLKKLVDLFAAIWPFLEDQIPAVPEAPRLSRQQKRSSEISTAQQQQVQLIEAARELAVAKQEEAKNTKKILDLVTSDLASSPVIDLVLRGPGVNGLITVSRDYLTDDVTAALMGGTFTVIGKVTAVNPARDAKTLVVRRGAMGAIAEASVLPMLEQVQEQMRGDGVNLDLPHGKLEGPFLQLIPLAIFV